MTKFRGKQTFLQTYTKKKNLGKEGGQNASQVIEL